MPRLETKRFLPHIMVLALVLLTFAVLAQPRKVRGNPEGPIPLVLPERLGPYRGEGLLFCQNDQCSRVFRESEFGAESKDAWRCLTCTNEVAEISIGEMRMLPKGTPIFRKVYSTVDRPDIQATLVFSGSERMSIHRPQVCLVSQGNRIVNEYDYEVAVTAERRIPARVIELVREYTNAGGQRVSEFAVYVYWFFNPERETSSHIERLLWMAYDNAARNYRPRWAYVSLAMAVDPAQPNAFKVALDDFVPRLYPITEKLRQDLRDRERAESR